jgi:hypothetical protein
MSRILEGKNKPTESIAQNNKKAQSSGRMHAEALKKHARGKQKQQTRRKGNALTCDSE